MGTLPGDRKVGRPMCEDRAYAEKMGVSLACVRRLGGAAKLKALPEESQALLVKPMVGNIRKKRLRHIEGAYVRRTQKEQRIEVRIDKVLRERGLVK